MAGRSESLEGQQPNTEYSNVGIRESQRNRPAEIVETFLGTPYRADGARTSDGHWVTFAEPRKAHETAGLNCSGFVVDYSRRLLDRNVSLKEAKRDRLGDSGPGAALGEDWDFGRDLILNVTEGRTREFILADASGPEQKAKDGLPARGFNLHDDALLDLALARMETDHLYLASISKPWHKMKPYRLIHYHVGAFIKKRSGDVWFYHTTRLSNTHGMNVSQEKGRERFHYQFAPSEWGDKFILIVGVPLHQ